MNLRETVEFEERRWLVGRQITCPSGRVLDVRTAVVLETAEGKHLGVLSPEAWASIRETFLVENPGTVVKEPR